MLSGPSADPLVPAEIADIDSPVIEDTQITDDPRVQQRPEVAVNPLDPNHVVIAFNDAEHQRQVDAELGDAVGIAVSRDGGETWQLDTVPLPAGFDDFGVDPSLEFDDSGRLFVAFSAGRINPGSEIPPRVIDDRPTEEELTARISRDRGLFVARSDDGGLSWHEPVAVAAELFDGDPVFLERAPDLAFDSFDVLPDGSPNPNYGNLYVTWTRFYPRGEFPGGSDEAGSDAMLAVSSDGGLTWEIQLEEREFCNDANGDGIPQDGEVITSVVSVLRDPINIGNVFGAANFGFGQVDVGPEGDVYVTDLGAETFTVFRSTDGGASFAGPDRGNELRVPFGPGLFADPGQVSWPDNALVADTTRQIVADPVRPGNVYVVEAITVRGPSGVIDLADVFFARSTDHGETWETNFTGNGAGGLADLPLNDDNGGQSATGDHPTEIITGQAFPILAGDEAGNLAAIWYDTRRDPNDLRLFDVFGTVSTDGGESFRPNFRVTDESFDFQAGKPELDAQVAFGFSGLAIANNTAYVAWADGRTGHQDIFFARFTIDPAPQALSDRFEPNDVPQDATELGRIVQRNLPALALAAGDEDWFRLQTAAGGELYVTALFTDETPVSPDRLVVELFDDTGTMLLAGSTDVLDESGNVIGRRARVAASAGDIFLVRVRGQGTDGSASAEVTQDGDIGYSLELRALTEDFGSRAFVAVDGTIAPGGGALYRVTAPAAGSLGVELTGGESVVGSLDVQILDPESLAILATGAPPDFVPVNVPSVEPNDGPPIANPTGLEANGAVVIDGSIEEGDFDFYLVQAGANQKLTIDIDAEVLGSELDPAVAIFNSLGQMVAFNLDADGSRDSFLEFVTPAPDFYFVLVSTFENLIGAPTSTGSYTATITSVALGPGEIEQAGVVAQQDETFLVLVSGADDTSSGDFTLEITNFDQFATPDPESLLVPPGTNAFNVEVGDLTGDGVPDIVVVDPTSDFITVLLGAGDGTFQPPRPFKVGAGVPSFDPFKLRQEVIADVSGDGIGDILVNNPNSADISVLFGRGDGTFDVQRRFDALPGADGFAVGDVNGDGVPDLVVGESAFGKRLEVAVLLGRGNGTFLPAQTFETTMAAGAISDVEIADFNGDDVSDLLLLGAFPGDSEIRLGNGDGTFGAPTFISTDDTFSAQVVDLDGNGTLDLILPAIVGRVAVHLGNGDGTFADPVNLPAGSAPTNVAVVDFASPSPSASDGLGPPDGRLDLVVTASGITERGTGEVLILPGVFEPDADGNFVLFAPAVRLFDADVPLAVRTADLDGDGSADLVVTDQPRGVVVLFGDPPQIEPNSTQATARDLGTAVHVLEPTRTIVPAFEDAWFRVVVPSEAVGGGDQVLEFSALFEGTDALGLQMEVIDSAGNVLGSGPRFRIAAAQGEELFVHVFGVAGPDGTRGTGAFTLAVDVLPQVVSVEAVSLLPGVEGQPGGPINSITVVLQGDRLDRAAAEDAGNYAVTFFGADGDFGTADDQVIPIGAADIEQSIVYNVGANLDVSSGQTFPTAIRQTVTLTFSEPLPVGSYVIELSSGIQAQPFNDNELDLLPDSEDFTGHPIVTLNEGRITEGVRIEAENLIRAPGRLADLSVFVDGTRFLTQLQNDLQTLLDKVLAEVGDDPSVTDSLLDQILARLNASLGEIGVRPTSLFVLVLDPMSFALDNLFKGGVTSFDLETLAVANDNPNTFIEVGGNVEVVVAADAVGTYQLDLSNVPVTARGGALILGNESNEIIRFTDQIRAGVRSLTFTISEGQAVVSRPQSIVNRSVTGDSQVQQQPAIAVNPLDPDHVVIAYHDESLVDGAGRFGIGISVSRDGGRTFSQSSVALPAELNETTGAGLPVLQFDADGRLYVFFDAASSAGAGFSPAAFANFEIGSGVFLAHSDDGGASWSDPTPIEFEAFTGTPVDGVVGTDFAIDTVRFLPDGSPNPHFGSFYATWETFPHDETFGVRFAVSRDGGATWAMQDLETPESADFDVPRQGVLGRARMTTGPDGSVYVSLFSAGKFRVLRSSDGGTTFVTSETPFDTRFAPFELESTGTPQNIDPIPGGWPDPRFRVEPVRSIVADPARPGHVYVADADADRIDRQPAFADIVFARSTDFGETFTEVGIGGSGVGLDLPLNDDNGGRLPEGFNEVVAAQVFPSLAVDDAGNLVAVWYDTRTDPDNLGIDVFGTVSTDGGQTFSPNVRITGQSIDLDAGQFTNFLGDDDVNFNGRGFAIVPPVVTLAAGRAFVAWTDTRGGNQDVFFASFTVNPAPAAFNDRFEINDAPDAATDLGRVVQRRVPKLVVTRGDEDWFRVEAATSGDVIAKVLFTEPTPIASGAVVAEIRDETGQTLLASSTDLFDEDGNRIGVEVRAPAAIGDTLLVRVNGETPPVGDRVDYELDVQSLTADLGAPAFASVSGSITPAAGVLFKYTAAADGALDLTVDPGRFDLEVLDFATSEVLATGHLGNLIQRSENNDTIFTPNALNLGASEVPTELESVTIRGFIGDGEFADLGDSDFYSVNLEAGQQLVIDVNADTLGSPINPVIALHGLGSGPLGFFFDDGVSNDPFVVFEAPVADTYVFAIVDNAGGPPRVTEPGTFGGPGERGPYEIVVTTSPAAAAVASIENNDTIFTPQPLNLSEFGTVTVEGFIGDGDFADIGDKDFYSVDLEAGQQLVIHADPATPVELATRVFGFNTGVDSGFLFDDGSPDSPLAVFEAPVSDTYVFLLVDATGGFPLITEPGRLGDPGATGPYRITVLTPHAGAPLQTSLPVLQGEELLIQVTSQAGSQGDFTLEFTNRDLFADISPEETLIPGGRFLDRIKTADLNRDGNADVVSVGFRDTFVQVILGNGDGTFQAPRQFAVGAALDHELAVVDVSGDGIPDIIVTNRASADVSVLVGRGDGTFAPQRRFDTTADPTTVATADFDNDGNLDLAIGSFSIPNNDTRFSMLLGRGDGTFSPQRVVQRDDLQTLSFSIGVGDVNGDGLADVVDFGGSGQVAISLGNGDGTFTAGPVVDMAFAQAGEGLLADLDGDGHLDLLQVEQNTGELLIRLGNGDGSFGDRQAFTAGAKPGGISVVDFGSAIPLPDGSSTLGPPDGKLDVVVVAIGGAVSGVARETGLDEAELVLLPGVFDNDDDGNFVLLGEAIQVTSEVVVPVDPDVADFDNDGSVDIAVAENRGIFVRFGAPPVIPPNTTRETARNLGTVVHLVQPTRTIVPGFEDAWFKLTVPTEAIGAGDEVPTGLEVLDVSALFEGTDALGLQMEVLDTAGNVLSRGPRSRIAAAQGQELFVHVFGVEGADGRRGTGAYTVAIDVLPQIVAIEAEALLPGEGGLPGGPINTLVVTFQGDRLDPATAEDPDNYTVTFHGPDGVFGTGDDRVIPVGGPDVEQPIVYNTSANHDITTGRTFPTDVRQTATLVFDEPLPAGSYTVDFAPAIQAAPFNSDELDLLADPESFSGHPLVTLGAEQQIIEGARVEAVDLVLEPSPLGDLSAFETGTQFLVQLQNDLSVLLDSLVAEFGDDPVITDLIAELVTDRFLPALGEVGERATSIAVIVIDPASFALRSPGGNETINDKQRNLTSNENPNTYFSAERNVDFIAVADAVGTFNIEFADVPSTGRLAILLFDNVQTTVLNLTDSLREGVTNFSFTIGESAVLTAASQFTVIADDAADGFSATVLVPNSLDGFVFGNVGTDGATPRAGAVLPSFGHNPLNFNGNVGTDGATTLAGAILPFFGHNPLNFNRSDLTATDQFFQASRFRPEDAYADLLRIVVSRFGTEVDLPFLDRFRLFQDRGDAEGEDDRDDPLLDLFWSEVGRILGGELGSFYQLGTSLGDLLWPLDAPSTSRDVPDSDTAQSTRQHESNETETPPTLQPVSEESDNSVPDTQGVRDTDSAPPIPNAGARPVQDVDEDAKPAPQTEAPVSNDAETTATMGN